jgi:DNA (cytosine-5)-methyltransferase 1
MARPKVLSLYSGAGGLDYGFEAAGFDTAVAVEMNHDACETLRQSRKWRVIERDIFEVPTSEMLKVAGAKRGEIDVLIGGPPCQPFSKSGYWARGDSARLDDPRSGTLGAYLRVLQEALPRTFLLENVEGLAYRGKDEGLRLLLDAIEDINRRTKSRYRPVYAVLSAADYGVPQFRNRFVMVASRDGRQFRFPEATHGGQPSLLAKIEPHRTAWDALGDVTPDADEDLAVKGKWADLLPSIPEGKNYLFHTDRDEGLPLFGWRRRYWSFLLKLAKNRPSWTIQAQPGPAVGPFHWNNRRLSTRELCRLQTFPDDVRPAGGRTSVQRQVGNAVPSLLAEVVAREIRRQLLDLAASRGEPRLMPLDRSPAPPPERALRVPKDLRSLAGEHSPHPGTGRGFAARRRSNATDLLDASNKAHAQ